jgi:hypothetical protein
LDVFFYSLPCPYWESHCCINYINVSHTS